MSASSLRRGEIYRVRQPQHGDPKKSRCFAIVSRQELLDSKANRILCAPVNTSGFGLATEVPVGENERSWQRGVIVLAADTVQLDDADITIGRYDLVIIANALTIHSPARIRSFERRNDGDSAPTKSNGEGADGLDAGNVYLVVLGNLNGEIDIDLRGEDGGPGAPGEDGKDVPIDPDAKPLPNDAVGKFITVTAAELKKRREGFKDSTPDIRAKQDEIIAACGELKTCVIPECVKGGWRRWSPFRLYTPRQSPKHSPPNQV